MISPTNQSLSWILRLDDLRLNRRLDLKVWLSLSGLYKLTIRIICGLLFRILILLWLDIFGRLLNIFFRFLFKIRIQTFFILLIFLLFIFVDHFPYMAKDVIRLTDCSLNLRCLIIFNRVLIYPWYFLFIALYISLWHSQYIRLTLNLIKVLAFLLLIGKTLNQNSFKLLLRPRYIICVWLGWRVESSTLWESDCVHAEYRTILLGVWEKLLALNCTCHNIAYYRILFGQIRGKVHLLPIINMRYCWEIAYHLYCFL